MSLSRRATSPVSTLTSLSLFNPSTLAFLFLYHSSQARNHVAAMGGDGDARGATNLKYNGTGAIGANPLDMDVNTWYEVSLLCSDIPHHQPIILYSGHHLHLHLFPGSTLFCLFYSHFSLTMRETVRNSKTRHVTQWVPVSLNARKLTFCARNNTGW
jgi:hypothetical protein